MMQKIRKRAGKRGVSMMGMILALIVIVVLAFVLVMGVQKSGKTGFKIIDDFLLKLKGGEEAASKYSITLDVTEPLNKNALSIVGAQSQDVPSGKGQVIIPVRPADEKSMWVASELTINTGQTEQEKDWIWITFDRPLAFLVESSKTTTSDIFTITDPFFYWRTRLDIYKGNRIFGRQPATKDHWALIPLETLGFSSATDGKGTTLVVNGLEEGEYYLFVFRANQPYEIQQYDADDAENDDPTKNKPCEELTAGGKVTLTYTCTLDASRTVIAFETE